jgi:carbonic anhydrase/acetyltransferase-like protein (isoleucine patch superfamily)
MTLIQHRGIAPDVDSSAFVAPTAVLVGRTRVGAHSRILYGAVLNSEDSTVEVGPTSIVSENAVLRATGSGETEAPVVLRDHVFVGPHATLLGCEVESCSFIATGATILQGAIIKPGSVVGVGALVHAKTVIPPEFFVPPNAVAIGDPVVLYGPDDGEAMIEAIKALGFSKTAFGVEIASRSRASIYRDVTEIRSKEYAAHFDDVVLTDEKDERGGMR